jgi:hypothetical protein
MKFIRTLWGDPKYFTKEIPKTPLYDEVVYVWGDEANNYLKNLGYNTILVSSDNPYLTDYKHSTFGIYILKLEALKLGIEQFGKVIFMDWDVKNIKPLDEQFYKDLEDKELLMPTYSYPKEFLSFDIAGWYNTQLDELSMYSWEMDDIVVIPNASFVYCNNLEIVNKLYSIAKVNDIKTLVEEFAMFIYSNCTLKEYIEKYEPKCLYGRHRTFVFDFGNIKKRAEDNLHDTIDSIIDKNIYFVHD